MPTAKRFCVVSLWVVCACSTPPAPAPTEQEPAATITTIRDEFPTFDADPEPAHAPTPPPPAWMLEPRGDLDRALLMRLLSADDATRKAAVDAWERDRVQSEERAQEASGNAWPPGPTRHPDDWAEKDDETPTLSGAAEIRRRFANRTRALARGLLGALREGDLATRLAAAASLGEMRLPVGRHLTIAFSDPAPEVRAAAVRQVASLSPFEASYPECFRSVLPLLYDADPRVRVAAIRCVRTYSGHDSNRGGEGLSSARPRLLDLTADPDAGVRAAALRALQEDRYLGYGAQVRALSARALGDPEAEVRRAGASWFAYADRATGRAAPLPPETVDALRRLVGDADLGVRCGAAVAVWRATSETGPAVRVLTESLIDPHDGVPIGTLQLLAEIGPDAEPATEAVLSFVRLGAESSMLSTGTEALDALRSIGPRAEIALPLFRRTLREGDTAERAAAAYALETLDGENEACHRLLEERLVSERDDLVRYALLRSRGAIPGGGDAAVADLLAGLRGGQFERWGPIEGLAAMGTAANAAAPHLQAIAASRTDRRALSAAHALVAVGGLEQAAAALSLVSSDPDRGNLIREIGAFGAAAAPAVGGLVQILSASPVDAARALAEVGPAAKGALPALVGRLRSSDAATRVAAAEAVLRIGGDAEPALRVVQDELDAVPTRPERERDAEPTVAAAYAAFRAGDVARPLVPSLRRALTYGSGELETATSLALWRLDDDTACRDRIVDSLASRPTWSGTPPIDLVSGLATMGPAAAPATDSLVHVALAWRTAFWKNSEVPVCREAIRALGCIGPAAASALPALRSLRRNCVFRDVAEEAIRRIAPR